MKLVTLTIVGFFQEINHVPVILDTVSPTVKDVLDTFRDDFGREAIFEYEERSFHFASSQSPPMPTSGSQVHSITYRGYSLASLLNTLRSGEERKWKFSVIRQIDGCRVLVENTGNIPFDVFCVHDGDEIYWSLVASCNSHASSSSGNKLKISDLRLIAV